MARGSGSSRGGVPLMGVRRWWWSAALLAAAVGWAGASACGDAFTSGGTAGEGGEAATGGDGGTAGEGGTGHQGGQGGGGAASGGGVGGGGGADLCIWTLGDDPCPPGYYCDAQDCGVGECALKQASGSADYVPVCGCDGLTYWNETVAVHAGMSIRAAAVCSTTHRVRCGGLAASECPDAERTHCSYEVAAVGYCGQPNPEGFCVVLPPACPSTPAVNMRMCSMPNGSCADRCLLVEGNTAAEFYEDGTCPAPQ